MGFDNECIVNIQSLAGEYFCPVCRTLVYPNEALQSQCTHLYCKPCLIYVVGTTKACPYDGYLVTEADSKPLVESDKALADKIAKTQVHCLFHRSGCPWQGPLSECTSHCSGCTFGNSPVVCNRCGIQIVHRQVQEHAQNCAGANTQAQQTAEGSKDAGTTATATTANLSQASSQLVQPSQGPASQTTIASASAHNTNSQVQANASAAGTTADQWYPQQFQQYYQQYPGYDPYQQAYMQFYPYQQQTGQALQQHAPHVVGQPQVYAQHPNAIQPHHQPLQQVQGQAQTQSQIQLQPQHLAQQQQPQNPSQGQPQAQSYAQNQVNPQQSHLVPQPHPQLQPAAQGQVPPQQPYPQAQPHLPPHSMQPPVQQNFQAPQYQQAQSQGHQAHLQMQPQPILQVQPQSHSLHPSQLNNPQSQQPAPHVGPGYHPPVQPQQQIPQAPPQQNSMQMHPISGSFPPNAQFPQQSPHMRPPQGNASVPNQQSNLMPGHTQMQGVPLAQHHQLRPQNQLGAIGHQRPAVQPTQPPLQQYGQQSFPMQGSGSGQGPLHQLPFAQQSMHALSRPQGPTQFQHGGSAPPPPPSHSSMQAHGVPYQQPQPYGGRPVAPNQVGQPYLQSGGAYGVDAHSRPMPASSVQLSGHQIYEGGTSNQQQAPSGQQFSQSGPAVKHTMGEGNAAGQEVGSGPNRTTGKDVSGAGVDSVGDKTVESETGERNGDKDHRVMSEGESNETHKEITGNVVDTEMDALKLGSSEKKAVNEEDANGNGNLDPLSGGDKIEAATVDEKDGNVAPKQLEYSSVTESTLKQSEAYVGHKKDDTTDMTQENNLSQEQVNPQGSAVNEYSGFQDKNSMNSSNPVPLADQGRHQMPPGPYGPSSHHQRPFVPSNLQSGPYPGAMPNTLLPGQGHAHLRPPGSGLSAPPRQSHYPSQPLPHSGSSHDIPVGGQPTPESVHPHESFEGVQSRQHYQNNPPHPQPVFSRTLNADPTGPIPGPDGAAMHQNQRPHPFEGRYPDPHVSGPFDRGHFIANENHAPGYEGLHAKNVADDHRNPFLAGPPGREYDDASKQFPKPAIMGVDPSSNLGNGFSSRGGDYPPHEFNYDAPSRFLPPYHPSGVFHPNDIGERPTGFHVDHRARGYSARPQPDFHGSGSGFEPDHLPPRSPGREYHGIPSRGFGGLSVGPHIQSGLEDIHEGSRSSDIALDPAGKPFREHFRNGDMRGQDFIPNHMRRGELFGPRNGPNHFVGGDGFGPFPDPRMGDLTGQGVYPHNESFGGNKSNHLRLGEPGYRSSYSHHGFPSDGGFYAGNTDSFDRFRRRMPTSMGWCRICKVDCDTVDGLDLHSQTTEHQQRTMDMVISIKQQNSKRQKMSKDHTSTEDGSRARNPGNRGRGKKA